MLEIHPKLLLYQGIVFVIFALLMWRFVYRKLVQIAEDRRRRVEEMVEYAEKQRRAADEFRQRYERRHAEFEERTAQVVQQAEEDGLRVREQIIGDARSEAAAIVERGRRQAEADRRQAVLTARQDIVDLAAGVARRALSRAVTPEVDRKLVADVAEELSSIQWNN
jgi:F-type H+-transporting ATPase subunit b